MLPDCPVEAHAAAVVAKAEPVGRVPGVLGTDVEIGGGSPVLEPRQGESNTEEARARPGIDRAVPSAAWLCAAGASVRAGLKEAIGVSWWRTKVKRRKAFLGGRAGQQRRCPVPVDPEGVVATRSRRNLSVSPQEICWVPARGLAGRSENERTTTDGPAEVRGPRSTGRRGNAR